MELKPLNFAIIKNPINWLIVLTMVFLGVLGIELFMKFFNVNLTNLNIKSEGE